jgi:crotonobetainyl-CoA:carnitine CoA-transferase CaiB-like acyl-CoA transferase
VAIAAETQEQWEALRSAMRAPEADDPRFSTLAGRKANEDEVEAIVAAFTASRTREEVVALLQPEVVAAPVNDPYDLLDDPQLLHRGYLVELEHTVMGRVRYQGPEATLSATPMRLSKAAPALGEDTRAVLAGLLGYSSAEIDELVASGAVEEFAQ